MKESALGRVRRSINDPAKPSLPHRKLSFSKIQGRPHTAQARLFPPRPVSSGGRERHSWSPMRSGDAYRTTNEYEREAEPSSPAVPGEVAETRRMGGNERSFLDSPGGPFLLSRGDSLIPRHYSSLSLSPFFTPHAREALRADLTPPQKNKQTHFSLPQFELPRAPKSVSSLQARSGCPTEAKRSRRKGAPYDATKLKPPLFPANAAAVKAVNIPASPRTGRRG